MEVSGQFRGRTALPPRKNPDTHLILGCVGPRIVLSFLAVVEIYFTTKLLEITKYSTILKMSLPTIGPPINYRIALVLNTPSAIRLK
jgi:hypothetical protein